MWAKKLQLVDILPADTLERVKWTTWKGITGGGVSPITGCDFKVKFLWRLGNAISHFIYMSSENSCQLAFGFSGTPVGIDNFDTGCVNLAVVLIVWNELNMITVKSSIKDKSIYIAYKHLLFADNFL